MNDERRAVAEARIPLPSEASGGFARLSSIEMTKDAGKPASGGSA